MANHKRSQRDVVDKSDDWYVCRQPISREKKLGYKYLIFVVQPIKSLILNAL